MRILIADDHEVVRSGLRSVLEARSGWKVIGEAQDGKDAIRKAIELRPNVAILDYGLPVANGVDATEVLIFTMHENEALIRKTFAAGARGYLLKSDIKQDLYAAIESVDGRTRALCRPHKADRTLTEELARGLWALKALLDGPRFSHTTNSQRNDD